MLVGCLTSQQQASVSQGRICTDNFTCCHNETEVAGPTFYLTQSQYTDTGATSPSADPITPGAWQGSHWSANFEVTGMTRPRKNPGASGIRTRDLPLSRRTPLPLGQRGGDRQTDRQTERQADRLPVGSVDQSRVIAPVGEDDGAGLGVERVVRDGHLTECGRVQGQNPSHRAGIKKT